MSDNPQQPLGAAKGYVLHAEAGPFEAAGMDVSFTIWRNATQADANIGTEDPRLAFFFHLGFAINHWALIEREIYHVFRFMLGNTPEPTTSFLFYNQQHTIKARFSMVGSLVENYLGRDHKKRWEAITKRFNKEVPIRNRLAHDPSFQIIGSPGTARGQASSDPPPPSWELHPERHKLLSLKKQKDQEPISIERIVAHINEVALLKNDISAFRHKLPKRLPRPPRTLRSS